MAFLGMVRRLRRLIPWMWLFGASRQGSVRICYCMKSFIKFVFWQGNWNSEYSGKWQGLIYIYILWLAGIGTLTRSHVIFKHYKSSRKLQDFKEVLYFNLVKQMHGKSNISQKPIFLKRWYWYAHMFLYWFIECLQVNRMCITSFWSYKKLAMKAK